MKIDRFGRSAFFALLAFCGFASEWVAAKEAALPALAETDASLDSLLTREAQRLLDADRLRSSKTPSVTVRVKADIAENLLVIDFGAGFLPAEQDHSTEEIVQYISNTLAAYAGQAGLHEVQVQVLYEGKPFEFYFPWPYDPDHRAETARVLNGIVLVSAGHGLVRVHPGGEWEYQRRVYHGVREDLITPGYADELQQLMQDRSQVVVHRARRDGVEPHPEALQPWEQMSSRYHLKALLPERVDIWNHFAGSTARDREVLDDIRARPYFANHLGAEGMISIHTNGDDSGVARGSRVYFHRGKPQDRELAAMLLCYMKELITAEDGYSEFPVSTSPSSGNHGENGFATMPAAVVEVAFHTNAADAMALQDPLFRTAAMKGVEKGYRLHREGRDCAPLKAGPIRGLQLPQGMSEEVDVPFEGYPQYPIELVTTNIACPPTWTCRDGLVRIHAPGDQPYRITIRCENVGTAPVIWHTSVVDADGVKSPPVRHSVVCIRNTGRADLDVSVAAGGAVAG
ncbi:N-acetylmuramoyl-L-alanine amidase [Stenotrophomonas sp. JAG2]|uniref:N-acetylmuramoyl-L-alanine amidase family protein n=1 Tax=Stenotrophomonas sp. JAG2 TaxID=3229243 RepID=UPI0034E2ABD3